MIKEGLINMMKIRNNLMLTLVAFVIAVSIFTINLPTLNSVGEVSYCCEKTLSGAWCQNAPQESCNPDYQVQPTYCETSSYCKLGYCYDSKEGTCLPNVPQKVCNDNGGVWSVGEVEPPQCSLGCCVLGDQAAFVTQTRCKRLSAIYSLGTDFRTDLSSETECLASVTSDVEGACVFEKEFETTCQRLTQKECQDLGSGTEGEISFHEGMLCSAEQLATNCGPSCVKNNLGKITCQTTCVENKDGVYFVDTCGNIANIYDSEMAENRDYWTNIKSTTESCNPESQNGNAGSAKCGNCDYYLGSTCHQWNKNEDRIKPEFGNNICQDLSCKFQGDRYKHGETWCDTNTELENSPGSEYFRMVCYNGEVTVENCDAFRQGICVQGNITTVEGVFRTASCRTNRWKDCVAQTIEKDCLNKDQRACIWEETGEKDKDDKPVHVCLPEYAPGFNFWEETATDQTFSAEDICPIANTNCTATFEKNIADIIEGMGSGKSEWVCKDNCECCVNDEKHQGCKPTEYTKWVNQKLNICTSLGDCGVKYNYIGEKGFYNETDIISKV